MRVLHLVEVKVLFPVLALFSQRRVAVANLHPLHPAIVVDARVAHVAIVFIAGDGSEPERSFVNRLRQRLFFAGFDARRDQIPHGVILRRHRRDEFVHQRANKHRVWSRQVRMYRAPACGIE